MSERESTDDLSVLRKEIAKAEALLSYCRTLADCIAKDQAASDDADDGPIETVGPVDYLHEYVYGDAAGWRETDDERLVEIAATLDAMQQADVRKPRPTRTTPPDSEPS